MSYVWSDNEVESANITLKYKAKEMQENVLMPLLTYHIRRIDVNLSGHVKSLGRNVQARTGLVRSAIYSFIS